MTKPNPLPGMDSDFVRNPEHVHRPQITKEHYEAMSSSHRILISATDTGWHWTHLLNAVGGWKVLAVGELPAAGFPTADAAAQEIERRWLGPEGNGIAALPPERFTRGPGGIAHITHDDDPTVNYCGRTAGEQATFDLRTRERCEQHCTVCDTAYRAAHYGRLGLPATP